MRLDAFIKSIRDRHFGDPHFDNFREVEDLLCFYLGMSWSDLHLKKDRMLTEKEQACIFEACGEMKKGRPLAYIIGEKYFYKSNFLVNENVLIPRPETEILVEQALLQLNSTNPRVMDFGTGSGCIGLSIAKERRDANLWLLDSEVSAIQVARKNGAQLGLTNVEFLQVQVGVDPKPFPQLIQKIDLIVANPPYIEQGDPRVEKKVHDHEPHVALYAPDNGLMWIHMWLIWGYDYLKEDGLFLFEFGENQHEAILAKIKDLKYEMLEIIKDYSGKNRFMKLRKIGSQNG